MEMKVVTHHPGTVGGRSPKRKAAAETLTQTGETPAQVAVAARIPSQMMITGGPFVTSLRFVVVVVGQGSPGHGLGFHQRRIGGRSRNAQQGRTGRRPRQDAAGGSAHGDLGGGHETSRLGSLHAEVS